jgi:hypothetical protein
LLTLATRWASSCVVLCVGRKRNRSSRSTLRFFTCRRTSVSKRFSKTLPTLSKDLRVYRKRGAWGSFPPSVWVSREHVSMPAGSTACEGLC